MYRTEKFLPILVYLEQILTMNALTKHVEGDMAFKLRLVFLHSEAVPSKSTFSRVLTVLSENITLLEGLNQDLLQTINQEVPVLTEPVSIDATAVDTHTSHRKTEDKKITSTVLQRMLPTEALLNELPYHPAWGIKANSEGRHNYWFGYKVYLAVSSHNQYILSTLTTSSFVSDMSVTIPFMRSVSSIESSGVYAFRNTLPRMSSSERRTLSKSTKD
ncbi:hypothetical protein IGI37_003039 [Enterococcus sp. AZ194]|uniref:hypothetical protein n=1 Tax=Enterococcus sp. AZ194 TaxID=2774629 RepID=UPI003F1FE8D0